MKSFINEIDSIIEKNIGLTGMTDEFFCFYIYNSFYKQKKDYLVVTPTLFEANKIYNTLNNFTDKVILFPIDDLIVYHSLVKSPELESIRLDALSKLSKRSENENYILVCHTESYMKKIPSLKLFNEAIVRIKKGITIDREKLINKLLDIGYNITSIVTNTGEIGIRGFVLDVFPVNNDYPVRVEFFDNEIESIRVFDPQNQKSVSEIDSIDIYPNNEDNFINSDSNILKFLNNEIVILKDYSQIKAIYNNVIKKITEKNVVNKKNEVLNFNSILFKDAVYYNTINNIFDNLNLEKVIDYSIQKPPIFNENVDLIKKYFDEKLKCNNSILVFLKNHQIEGFKKYISKDIVLTSIDKIHENKINIIEKNLDEGFIFNNYIIITQKELYNKKNSVKYTNKYKYSSKIRSLSNLKIGDYVVHIENGIGIYNGIKTLNVKRIKKDFLEILYAGKDKLYIPVEKIELIGKYTGQEGIVPKLSKLSSSDWQKTKLKARNRINSIAKELLEIHAKRKLQKGFKFSKDDELQIMFENEFEFEETPDQLRAINQIKQDMEIDNPMDRLLCGDVGYGKTEVAFRAMFKAVRDSKQVLYLCPTTILSKQQYDNALVRFSNYPVRIELLNRFTTTKTKNAILNDLKNGKIDILIGTHRILSKDIIPKDLGLLIIDEEQRFGVSHKETIKKYKENVDVLTLTATPIPRTLQMSLVGIKSLSLIETPPVDRYPIQTYVIEEDEMIVKDAIYKELSRNGQIFILYNKIESIEKKAYEISKMVPEANIVIAHGQLDKEEIENRMNDFISHKYDILICTTIIETGIDIPNVNTLIVYNADHFGLSQLYQIRGRVGRSDKIAYSYLLYKKDKVLNEAASKRLNAIKEFTELGSGFSIASRDLSIRGAGDILGTEQAGFIDSIGIDLYLKILNDEVDRLKGVEIDNKEEATNNLLNVETHIKDEYVKQNDLKIEIHKLINSIDSYEKLASIKNEIEDRFGKIDESIEIYMYEQLFETYAKEINISRVEQTEDYVKIVFPEDVSNLIDYENLFIKTLKINKNFQFQYKNKKLIIEIQIQKLQRHFVYYLTELLKIISEMINKH